MSTGAPPGIALFIRVMCHLNDSTVGPVSASALPLRCQQTAALEGKEGAQVEPIVADFDMRAGAKHLGMAPMAVVNVYFDGIHRLASTRRCAYQKRK